MRGRTGGPALHAQRVGKYLSANRADILACKSERGFIKDSFCFRSLIHFNCVPTGQCGLGGMWQDEGMLAGERNTGMFLRPAHVPLASLILPAERRQILHRTLPPGLNNAWLGLMALGCASCQQLHLAGH